MTYDDDVPEGALRVVYLQIQPVMGAKEHNIGRSLEMIVQAAQAVARMAALPELRNTCYVFATREEAFSLAEELAAGVSTQAWIQAARMHDITIIVGMSEHDGDVLYNSAVVVAPYPLRCGTRRTGKVPERIAAGIAAYAPMPCSFGAAGMPSELTTAMRQPGVSRDTALAFLLHIPRAAVRSITLQRPTVAINRQTPPAPQLCRMQP